VQVLASGRPVGVLGVVVEAARGVEEAVGDDAVVLGPAAGADGEAANQRDRWKRRHHVVRPRAFASHAVEP